MLSRERADLKLRLAKERPTMVVFSVKPGSVSSVNGVLSEKSPAQSDLYWQGFPTSWPKSWLFLGMINDLPVESCRI